MKFQRIPFDSFVLSAVVAELQAYVGGRVQSVRQPNETEVSIGLYAGGGEAMLLLSCHPVFARAYLATKRPSTLPTPPAFCATLRSRVDGAVVEYVRQIQGDRIMELGLGTPGGTYRLVAELMGKHSNLILVEPGGRVLSAAKYVGRSKSSRPIQSGAPYSLPPVMSGGSDLKGSPFYAALSATLGHPPRIDHPVLSPGHGAYPASVAALGLPEHPRSSISVALEQHYAIEIPRQEAEALRASLTSQLSRVLLARDTALEDLGQAKDNAGRAGKWQRYGELLLAYGPSFAPGAREVEAWDYDGSELKIKVDPELGFKENANLYFERAKKAKARVGLVEDQIRRLSEDRDAVAGLLHRVETTERLDALRELQEEARRRRWLTTPSVAKTKEERPYEGHRVRELVAPGGWTVLYGENAEANDYLTLRVAKPNDWWLHVRGNTSAHVVIVTRNQAEKVQRDAIEFAARVAVQHSPSKHAGYVPVDYTLKKYVRKPKGSPKGSALYTHEKTLHIDGDR